ncbi:MAG: hypothetical protein OEX21_04430 [Betaproteobacteria bacterium]|nr:hypothetical protein [Betaproteobacteria bacterium]
MKRLTAMLTGMVLFASVPAAAQEVSEGVKRACRSVSSQTARTIVYALRANIDPATQVKRVPDSWMEGVQAHMLLAASKAPHLSEEELAALGYSYCVSRRPTDR